MELNPEIDEVLLEYKIDRSQGLLALLGIYFGLNIATTCSEETIMAINITKIIDKDYENGGLIKWNMPLFKGVETEFSWVGDWINAFGQRNPERRGSVRDAISRMKKFFSKYPEYRKDDVYKARDLYLRSVKDSQYVMKSHKFIFDGAGYMQKSTLLEYCEKVRGENLPNQQKGRVL